MSGNIRNARRGVVSLLAVLLMAAITAIALGASLIILSELRQTSAINQSVVAVYAAEAGLEDGLFAVKLNRERGNTLDEVKAELTKSNQALGNAKWSRAPIAETQLVVPQLLRDQTVTVDYFNPDGGTQTCPDGSTGRSCVESIRIRWRDYCPDLSANGFAWLETTMFSFPTDLTFDVSDPNTYVFKDARACNIDINTGTCSAITYSSVIGGDLDPTKSLRFSFRELVPLAGTTDSSSCVVQNMTVTGYTLDDPDNSSAKEVPILGQITVKATGTFGQTQQALTASVPWRAPVSGLASFVIFSEEDIVK